MLKRKKKTSGRSASADLEFEYWPRALKRNNFRKMYYAKETNVLEQMREIIFNLQPSCLNYC